MTVEATTEPHVLPEEERLAANLAALKSKAPHLHSRLSAVRKTHAELIIDHDGGFDLDLMGQRFYGGDAAAFAERQLDDYFSKPLRNYLNQPDPVKLFGSVGDFCIRVTRRLAANGLSTEATANPQEARFLVMFGVGLGCHVATAIERSGAKVVMLIEPNLEMLYHSFRIVDWREILDRAADQNRKLCFLVDNDAARISGNVCNIVRQNNPALLDGTYLYTHYPSSILAQACDMVRRDIYLTLTGLGYFEDEAIMTRNAVANIGRGDARILSQYYPAREEPLFIVGSGPSLENDLEFLRSHRDRAVICSIGTSLRPLLAKDIRPDIHVEVENTANTADALAASSRGFDLYDIRLLASVTVHPRVVAAFDQATLFFCERVSATTLLGGGLEPVSPSGPTVANASLSAALRLGFREIYLFGVDMGTKQKGKYHAADTLYAIGELAEKAAPMHDVPGNLGGDVSGITGFLAMPVFNWSRHMLEGVLAANPSVTVYNCSDGARIAGAVPKVSRAVELVDTPIDRTRLASEIDGGLIHYGPKLAMRRWSRAERQEEADAMMNRVIELIDDALQSPAPDLSCVDAIFDVVRPDGDVGQVALSYLSGTMMVLLGCATWYGRHLTDPTKRDSYTPMALEELGVSVSTLRDRMADLFEEVDQKIGALVANAAAAE